MFLADMSKTKKNRNRASECRYIDNSCIEKYAKGKHMASSIQFIKDILKRENASMARCPFETEKAVNLDEFEIKSSRKSGTSRSRTVDCVVGLENNCLLMVEMKFRVKTQNMKNIARNVKDKRASSRVKLDGWEDYACLNKIVVLLNDDKFEIQKSCLYRALGMDMDYEILRISEFYNKYFAKSADKIMC